MEQQHTVGQTDTGLRYDRKGRHVLLRIPGKDCGPHGELSPMVSSVEQLIGEGVTDIVVVFEDSAYLYTRALAALIRSFTMVDAKKGFFAIVAPNPLMMKALNLAGMDAVIKTFASEADLPE